VNVQGVWGRIANENRWVSVLGQFVARGRRHLGTYVEMFVKLARSAATAYAYQHALVHPPT
jgi:hypothetical protein